MCWSKLKAVGKWLIGVVVLWLVMAVGLGKPALAGPFQQGITAVQVQDYEAAVQAFTAAIAQDDHGTAAYGNRCLVHLWTDHLEQAITDCSTVIEQQGHPAQAHLNRGIAHYRLGHYAQAKADFTDHLKHWPQDGLAYYNRGLAAFALGDTEMAISDYQAALTRDDTLTELARANVYNDLGVAYLSQFKPAIAAAYLAQAVSLNQNDPRAHFNYGCACHHQGNDVAALASFEQVLALDPTHAETHLNRAMVRGGLGDQAGAIADLHQAQHYFQQQGNTAQAEQIRALLIRFQRPHIAIG
jgi:tetratricopeptide (TPR) repeat protein